MRKYNTQTKCVASRARYDQFRAGPAAKFLWQEPAMIRRRRRVGCPAGRLDFVAWRRQALPCRPAESADGSALTLAPAKHCTMAAHAQRRAISGPAHPGRCRARSPERSARAL
ncbi:unnamed protein product [Ixodes hexagonus]